MEDQIFSIKFENVSAAEASLYAQEFQELLRDNDPSIKTELRKTDEFAQDIGSELVAFIVGGGGVAFIQTLQAWLTKTPNAEVTIEIEKKGTKKNASDQRFKAKANRRDY